MPEESLDSTSTFQHKPSIIKQLWNLALDILNSFNEDDCYTKASALTYYSLLSIVPVFAVLLGIAKGFGFEKSLEVELTHQFPEQPEVTEKLLQFAHSWLNTVQGGVIVGIGVVFLLYAVFSLLNSVEQILNSIWKTKLSRSIGRKISDYLAIILICPIFLVVMSSMNVYLTTQITQGAQNFAIVEVISPMLFYILKLFPYFLSWVLFTLVYLIIPNTKVPLTTAIFSGLLGGTLFQLWQWIYIKFQIGVSSYGAIYGSFAAIPLFLLWMQISWLIFLGAAEAAMKIANWRFYSARTTFTLHPKAIALFITYRCIEAFIKGKRPVTDYELSLEVGVSLHTIHSILESLKRESILSSVSTPEKTYGYQPARDIRSITMHVICNSMDNDSEIPASVHPSLELNRILTYLKQTNLLLEDPKYNQLVYEL